jgi:hypothetical protein
MRDSCFGSAQSEMWHWLQGTAYANAIISVYDRLAFHVLYQIRRSPIVELSGVISIDCSIAALTANFQPATKNVS